jgi:hypothetical protein
VLPAHFPFIGKLAPVFNKIILIQLRLCTMEQPSTAQVAILDTPPQRLIYQWLIF